MASNDFNLSRIGQHQGYTYQLLRKSGIGQDKYLASAESLSIKTDVFATEREAEECIKKLIEHTYESTFKKSQANKNAAPKKVDPHKVDKK